MPSPHAILPQTVYETVPLSRYKTASQRVHLWSKTEQRHNSDKPRGTGLADAGVKDGDE